MCVYVNTQHLADKQNVAQPVATSVIAQSDRINSNSISIYHSINSMHLNIPFGWGSWFGYSINDPIGSSVSQVPACLLFLSPTLSCVALHPNLQLTFAVVFASRNLHGNSEFFGYI